MKAVVVREVIPFGDNYDIDDEVMKKHFILETDFPKPEPEPKQLLLKVLAGSINPADYKIVSKSWAVPVPHVPCFDLCGEIVGMGAEVDANKWKVGTIVSVHNDLRMQVGGGAAEYAVVVADACTTVPEGITPEIAAAIPCAGMTAYIGLTRKMNLRNAKTILVTAGAGGVGGYGIQFAKALGLRVYTTCSAKNFEYVKNLGAEVAIDYNKEDIKARILELTNGDGVDAVFDCVSADSATKSMEYICFNGSLNCIVGLPSEPAFQQALSIHATMLGAAHFTGHETSIKDLAAMNAEILDMVKNGKIDPLVERVIGLEDVGQGMVDLKNRHVKGKIVVKL